ncbi:MAG: hypothetical protein R6X23_14650 [Acidimicrobiia bacterium]
MPDPDAERIAEAVDHVAIRRLQSAYADVVSRRAWAELGDLFLPDADTGEWNNAFGVYHDRYRRVDGEWRFARRRYHSLARTSGAPHLAEVLGYPTGVDLD